MAARKETSASQRSEVILLHKRGETIREISEFLKIPKSTVADIISRKKIYRSIENRRRIGRPSVLTRENKRFLVRAVKKDPFVSGIKLAAELESIVGKPVSRYTVSRALNEDGIMSRTPRDKPFISEQNRHKRLAYAKMYVDQPLSFWKRVLWTDESKFNVRASDGRIRVWRTDGTALQTRNMHGTVKHGGGSVMVWGGMFYAGVATMEFIEGTMFKEDYRDILERNIAKSTKKYRLSSNFIFMHDNDPKHKSKLVTDYLAQKHINVLDHPPQSPDLNPIEHLWDEIGREVQKKHVTNRKQLMEEIRVVWDTISPEKTQNLVESMPRRLAEVIKYKGGHTHY